LSVEAHSVIAKFASGQKYADTDEIPDQTVILFGGRPQFLSWIPSCLSFFGSCMPYRNSGVSQTWAEE